MSRKIIVHDEARFDAIDAAYQIAEDSLEAADRFAHAVDAAYEQLADMPGLGASRDYNNPRLKGMRMWPVPGFRKHLIFGPTVSADRHTPGGAGIARRAPPLVSSSRVLRGISPFQDDSVAPRNSGHLPVAVERLDVVDLAAIVA